MTTSLARSLRERLSLVERMLCTTAVVELEHPGCQLFAKLEYGNPVGSIKDRPAFWILKRAIERGEVGPETTVIESSSGNFARALAAYCRLLELRFVPVIDPAISSLYEAQLRTLCHEVVKVESPDETGGYLKTRLDTVHRLLAETPNSFWTNQYGNRDGMEAHYRLTGREIVEQVPELDYVFVGVSSGGTVAGVSRRLADDRPQVRVIAVDAVGSAIFGQPPAPRRIPGLGSSIVPPLVDEAVIADRVFVSEAETIDGCHRLLERHGLFVGGSTGTVYSAIERYLEGVRGRPRVLFLCCDRGSAYLPTVYDRQWAARRREDA